MLKNLLCSIITAFSVTGTHAGDFDNYEELQALIVTLEREGGYAEGELAAMFSSVKRQQRVIDAIARPAEKSKEWKDYGPMFLSNDRINKGVEFWQTYNKALNLAYKTYGVPPEMIVAIIGVETKYGGNKGNFKVIESLASLGFDYPPRAPFFRKELKNFLLLAKEQGMNPLETYGSYAGAMGFPQFMPSSWRNLAVDFDGDGHIDLINNPIDAIGSVANYFKANGWKTGDAVITRARIINDNYDEAISKDLKTNATIAELAAKGLTPREGNFADTLPASGLRFQGENGAEFWLAFNNFYVITTYNRSHLYALAAYQLSLAIKDAYSKTVVNNDTPSASTPEAAITPAL